jgi:hypothetical protein
MQIGSTLFTVVVVCLDGIFISDAHALAVLPDIARFALNKELPGAFIIVAYERGGQRQKVHLGRVDGSDVALGG